VSLENPKVMVVSTKGGVGKSTIAMQLIAPFLYVLNRKKPIAYFECDDENSDFLSFGDTKLIDRKLIKVASPILREELSGILFKNTSTCIDVGGNKSTTIVLDALYDSGAIHLVDIAVIPILDGEQDGINATFVYNQIKAMKPNMKFVFILNRVRDREYLKYQFDNFFGDARGIFKNVQHVQQFIDERDKKNYIALLDDEIMKYSRRFGLTVYEIAHQKREFLEKIKSSDNILNEDESKLISFKNYIDQSAKEYYDTTLLPAFKQLNSILKERRDD
jgi:hypothetical protein